MTLKSIILILFLYYSEAFALVISSNNNLNKLESFDTINNNYTEIYVKSDTEDNTAKAFDGVYTECFLSFSYSCIQKKTLIYLKELDKLNEVSVIGDYVKFVKINNTNIEDAEIKAVDGDDLSNKIDEAVDVFFNNHVLKFRAMGRDMAVPNSVDEFVGRKRKGGGGGGGGHDHGGGDDGGKKKMMMMAMMCMKMKFMMMVPAMLGMMGMMSFKGMMFSMMSFMMAKMMLLMKILEKKGGGGMGGGWMDGGGGGGGWAAGGGGGGGAWMPAGGQDYGGGGGGGGAGYDSNGQWQSRSIAVPASEALGDDAQDPVLGSNEADPIYGPFDEDIHGLSDDTPIQEKEELELNKPIITYVKPIVTFNNRANGKKPLSTVKKLRDEVIKIKVNDEDSKLKPKSRKKRGIVDLLQNAYLYWISKVLSLNSYNKYYQRFPRYKVVNGLKYVYYPMRPLVHNTKAPIDLKPKPSHLNNNNANLDETEEFKPIITAEEFNKGEIVEGAVESRMTKKLNDWKNNINEAIEGNEWQ